MGLFSDLAMGLGLADRDASYYDRTAATIGRTRGAGREAKYRKYMENAQNNPQGGIRSFFTSFGDPRLAGGGAGSWGYGEGDQRVGALRDMLDGGGRGRAGQRFEGGMLANLANALGIRPLGYQDRLAAAQQQPSPTRAAAPSGPNWGNPAAGIALGGSAPRFGEIDQPLSFGGGAMPQYPTSSPLSFGSPFQSPPVYSGRGSYGMPEQPSQIPFRPDLPFGRAAHYYGHLMKHGMSPAKGPQYMAEHLGYGIPRSR